MSYTSTLSTLSYASRFIFLEIANDKLVLASLELMTLLKRLASRMRYIKYLAVQEVERILCHVASEKVWNLLQKIFTSKF